MSTTDAPTPHQRRITAAYARIVAEVEIRVLGPLTASRGDQPVVVGPAQRRLLALLAVRAGQVVTRDQIADVLGVGSGGAVRTAVSRLRRLVGDVVSAHPPGYLLDPSVLDAHRFDALLTGAEATGPQERVDVLRRALNMWRGAALVEFASEEWARGEAVRLDERHVIAMEQWIDALATVGRTAEAAAHAQALAADYPLRERPRVLLMAALAEEGRTTEALRAFQDYRHTLIEVGAVPSAELRRLERRLLAGEEAVAPAGASSPRRVMTNLPAAEPLLGRADDSARVVELVRSHRLVTVRGPGGVGKSQLAVAVARRLVADVADGTWLVELAPLTGSSSVVGAIAGVVPRAMAATPTELVEQIGARQMILVLDNCEHLIDDVADVVAALVAGCPGVRVLATSQESLALHDEHVWTLAPLADGPAASLFTLRAAAVRPDLDVDGSTAGDIVRRLDGLPLAIELAAARVETLSPGEIASQLDDRFALLSTGPRARHPRHGGLTAMVEWGLGHCALPERRLFRRLGVFAGSFSRDAATRIADLEGAGSHQLAVDLDQLVRRSLVVADVTADPTRYRLLETLRHYATDRLDEAGETRTMRRRHAEWYADMALDFRGVETIDETRWLARGVAELDNLRAAVAHAVEDRDADLGIRLVSRLLPLHPLWRVELLEWARLVLQLPGAHRHPDAGPVFILIAALAWTTGNFDESERASDEALARPLDDSAFVRASQMKGAMLGYRGRFTDAHPVAAAARRRATSAALRLALDGQQIATEAYTRQRAPIDHGRFLAETDALGRPGPRSLHRTYVALALIGRGETARARELLEDALEIAAPGLNRYAVNLALEARALAMAGSTDRVAPVGDLRDEAAKALDLIQDYPIALGFALVGLMVNAHRLDRLDVAARLAGYLTTHADELGLPTASAEIMAGAPLVRFVAPDHEPDRHRGETMTASEVRAELERLTRQ